MSSDGESAGHSLVKVLTELLWLIDGHHGSLKDQSCPVPVVFSSYTGYNVPEYSKHRKRSIGNLSAESLNALNRSLFSTLHANFWKRKYWQLFHLDVQSLAGSIAQYSDYLNMQNKIMLVRHKSMMPIRSLANSVTLSYHKATRLALFHDSSNWILFLRMLLSMSIFSLVIIFQVVPGSNINSCNP